MDYWKNNLHLIVKFQALFRGHLARRNTAFIMKSKRVSKLHKYLNDSKYSDPFLNFRLTLVTSQLKNLARLYQEIRYMTHMPRGLSVILILSKQELPIVVSGLADSEMVTENSSGLMELDMKVNGKTIELMEKESSLTSTEISTRVIG